MAVPRRIVTLIGWEVSPNHSSHNRYLIWHLLMDGYNPVMSFELVDNLILVSSINEGINAYVAR